jgi:dipeptidyl aminopeptidase/acylaminoacyl peptidase
MKRLLIFPIAFFAFYATFAQSMLARYQKAEQLLPRNISDLTRNVSLRFHEVNETNDFWYQLETVGGEHYYYFDGDEKTTSIAFDHQKLADAVFDVTNKKVHPDSLNLEQLSFKPDSGKMTFRVDTFRLETDLANYSTKVRKSKKIKTRPGKNQSFSPSRKWMAEVKEYNLILKNTETDEEFRLTDDGVEKYEYATPLSWYKLMDESKGEVYDPSIQVIWSDDSKKFIAPRLDRRKVGKMFLYQSLPDTGFRAKVWSYERALPGEDPITTEYYIFDVENKTKTKVNLEPFADFTGSISPTWMEDNKAFYFAKFRRGYKAIDLFRVNAETGEVTTLLTDSSKTMVEYQTINCEWLQDGSQFFWTSERDGWNHIYRYDKNGKLLNQVTTGEFVVRDIVKVDEENRLIYFIAGGKEPGVDPYYRHLYVVDFSGDEPELLTPENADHQVWLPHENGYFVDSYSRVDLPTEHVVRSLSDGKIIARIATANIDDLLETGWKYPEPFKVKARDGKTDIYGLMYVPSDFDPSKKYPVIDATYSGPQAVRTPKNFAGGYSNYDRSIAELGFAVITIDGLGSAWRSKAFHDVSYQNLGDIGAADHIGGIKQLTATRPWMDLERVGIYGHSAGGYDAVRAMLTHPEFYKAAVSSAGNHDHRIAKAWWPEQYMGLPGKHYDEQSNLNLAGNLEGKLLLVHGDMDNNVNTASSLRLAAELVKRNKDFELLIIPNRNHGLADHPYFIRKRWDWFVKHLLKEEPPGEFEVSSYK